MLLLLECYIVFGKLNGDLVFPSSVEPTSYSSD